jgi:hypothetical protein
VKCGVFFAVRTELLYIDKPSFGFKRLMIYSVFLLLIALSRTKQIPLRLFGLEFKAALCYNQSLGEQRSIFLLFLFLQYEESYGFFPGVYKSNVVMSLTKVDVSICL